MATVYKLTTEADASVKGDMEWGPAVTNSIDPGIPETQPLCTDAWVHVYESEAMVHFLNPAHLNLETYHVWEATGTIAKSKNQVIHGVRELTTNSEVALTFPTPLQRQKFAVLVYQGNVAEPPSALFSATAWLNSTQDPANTARFINALYQPMLDAARVSVSLARQAAEASHAAAAYVNDAGALNDALYARRAAGRAENALSGSPNWDQVVSSSAEAIERAGLAADAASAAAVGADAVYPLLVRAKNLAAAAARDIAPAIESVILIYAAKCTLATDEAQIALLSARTAVLAGAAAEARGTQAGLSGFAAAAMA